MSQLIVALIWVTFFFLSSQYKWLYFMCILIELTWRLVTITLAWESWIRTFFSLWIPPQVHVKCLNSRHLLRGLRPKRLPKKSWESENGEWTKQKHKKTCYVLLCHIMPVRHNYMNPLCNPSLYESSKVVMWVLLKDISPLSCDDLSWRSSSSEWVIRDSKTGRLPGDSQTGSYTIYLQWTLVLV